MADGPRAGSRAQDGINWACIERFIGFGRRDAPVVFVGMEERLDPASNLVAELKLRSTYADVMDLLDAFGPGASESDLDFHAPTWRVMCDLMVRRAGEEPTLERRRAYQCTRLGRRVGDSLLCELLPFPNVNRETWAYAGISSYRDRSEYVGAVIDCRKRTLRKTMFDCDRELVVCYGKDAWGDYRDLFGNVSWRQRGSFEITNTGKARVVLTPHFGRWFSGERRLNELAEVALDPHAF